jgi:hypothetical protein
LNPAIESHIISNSNQTIALTFQKVKSLLGLTHPEAHLAALEQNLLLGNRLVPVRGDIFAAQFTHRLGGYVDGKSIRHLVLVNKIQQNVDAHGAE